MTRFALSKGTIFFPCLIAANAKPSMPRTDRRPMEMPCIKGKERHPFDITALTVPGHLRHCRQTAVRQLDR